MKNLKIVLEQWYDSVIGAKVYSMKIGKNEYLYERLEDVLHRTVKIFEPPSSILEGIKPRKKGKFPLSATVKSLLEKSGKAMTIDEFIPIIPRKFSRSIWGAVLGRMVKKGIIEVVKQEGKTKWYGWKKKAK